MQLTLGEKTFELELNFRRIQQAQRKLGLSVWPPGADYNDRSPHEFVHRLFAAAAGLTLDESYDAVGSEEDLAKLGDAIHQLMQAYQPEKWWALLTLMGIEEEPKPALSPTTSGTNDGPSPAPTSDSPAPTSESAPSASGPTLLANGSRGKQRETTRRHA